MYGQCRTGLCQAPLRQTVVPIVLKVHEKLVRRALGVDAQMLEKDVFGKQSLRVYLFSSFSFSESRSLSAASNTAHALPRETFRCFLRPLIDFLAGGLSHAA